MRATLARKSMTERATATRTPNMRAPGRSKGPGGVRRAECRRSVELAQLDQADDGVGDARAEEASGGAAGAAARGRAERPLRRRR